MRRNPFDFEYISLFFSTLKTRQPRRNQIILIIRSDAFTFTLEIILLIIMIKKTLVCLFVKIPLEEMHCCFPYFVLQVVFCLVFITCRDKIQIFQVL